ncbi:uncharacterized protein METZ01_LOCUS419150 [marine metagenome]|uniref:Uncharacterized protein n=1 Tax=marine metagenome TaxID=408172 RepID=A0A382X557_9ZZZZ
MNKTRPLCFRLQDYIKTSDSNKEGSQIVKQKGDRNDPLLTVYDGEMNNQIKSIIILNNY